MTGPKEAFGVACIALRRNTYNNKPMKMIWKISCVTRAGERKRRLAEIGRLRSQGNGDPYQRLSLAKLDRRT